MGDFDFDPLEFFISEIDPGTQTAETRIQAVKRLEHIAYALGPPRTADALIPYLSKMIGMEGEPNSKDASLANDDEFLFSMAHEYAKLREYIPADKVPILIKPLVYLAQQEETVIRDEAINSICTICCHHANLVKSQVFEELKEMVKSPQFTTRVSACALFGTVYKIHKEEANVRQELCSLYKGICQDETPMVKRASANKLLDFVKEMESEDLTKDAFLEAYKSLAQEDTQDTIRVNVVLTTIEMARKIDNSELKKQHCLPVIWMAVKDQSWRVRLTVAKNFDQILIALGFELAVGNGTVQYDVNACQDEKTRTQFTGFLITALYAPQQCQIRDPPGSGPESVQCGPLLQDQEQEVKKEAVMASQKCLKLTNDHPNFGPGIKNHLDTMVTKLMEMQSEASQPVRAALAAVLGPVAEKLQRDKTKSILMPVIVDLLRDEFHEVRLNLVSHAGTFCRVLTTDVFVQNLLQTVQALIMDNHWRIRKMVVENVPSLAEQFGVDMFTSKLESLFLSSLKDSVFFVRKEALNQLKTLCKHFGSSWTCDKLLPKILDMYSNSKETTQQQTQVGYASRVTVLQAIPFLWDHICLENAPCSKATETVVNALKDSVPNVRFCACKVIHDIAKLEPLQGDGKEAVRRQSLVDLANKVRADLNTCISDTDNDVQYFAGEALAVLPK